MTPATIPAPRTDPADATAAATRFAASAAPDVSYALLDTPIGRLVAASTARGLVRLAYEDWNGGLDEVLGALAHRLSPGSSSSPPRSTSSPVSSRSTSAGAAPRSTSRSTGRSRRRSRDVCCARRSASPTGRPQRTPRSPPARGARAAHARPATRSGPTRCRSSSPATAWCAPAAPSVATRGGWSARSACSRSSTPGRARRSRVTLRCPVPRASA